MSCSKRASDAADSAVKTKTGHYMASMKKCLEYVKQLCMKDVSLALSLIRSFKGFGGRINRGFRYNGVALVCFVLYFPAAHLIER